MGCKVGLDDPLSLALELLSILRFRGRMLIWRLRGGMLSQSFFGILKFLFPISLIKVKS